MTCGPLSGRHPPISRRQTGGTISLEHQEFLIPRISDQAAWEANAAAIDRTISTNTYHHVVAWGKWLGFTPETVSKMIAVAHEEHAPADALQKIDGRWLGLHDIQNESNRKHVDELTRQSALTRPEQSTTLKWLRPPLTICRFPVQIPTDPSGQSEA